MGDNDLLDETCYGNQVVNPNPIWKSEDILINYLPTFAGQVVLVIFATRFLYYILRPLNQPRLVAEILAGCLLSPGILGKWFMFVLPLKGVLCIETISHLGLIYYVFLIGLEMNLGTISRAVRNKARGIAIASTIIPMALGAGIYVLVQNLYKKVNDYSPFHDTPRAYLFWTLVLSVTGFPVLAHILADLKILYTELGRVALTAAMINDFYNWVMFALFIPFAINGQRAIYSVLSTITFCLFCFLVLRPPLARLLVKKTDKNDWDNFQLSFVIMGVYACAAVTDILGTHPIIGALVYGLIIPRGRFTDMLIEKTDDVGSGYLAPLFFVSCGIRINIRHAISDGLLFSTVVIVLLSSTTKIISIVIATSFHGMAIRDSVALGVLMNTKGILSLIMLNIAWNKQILSLASFSSMVVAILIMTAVVSPIINFIYKPRKQFEQNKLRTILNLKANAEIRVLASVHNTRHAKGMINILEAFNGGIVSPLLVFALQLVELKGRTTALLAAHIEQPNSHQAGGQAITQSQAGLESITNVFEAYAQEHEYTSMQILAAVSSYATIHEDIYNLAEEKQASLILLPFHKQSSTEGTLEITNVAFKDINQHVMQNAPCSVGIFVDRGLKSLLNINLRFLMLFIGGPDDREALAIAWRMSRHPRIQLTILRVLLLGEAAEVDTSNHNEARGLLSTVLDNENQNELDDEYVSSFRLLAVNNEDSITYTEMEVHNSEDIPIVLNELDQKGYDLYILGQGKGRNSSVLSNLSKWTDCPELGVIGDIVASDSFGSCSSLLVVQQYGFGGMDFGTRNTHPSNQAPSTNDHSESLFVKTE